MVLVDQAQALFEGPNNCAQAVFAPFADHFGLSSETALKIATPFGGGMGHAGSICGAVSGGLMAIGLARGTAVGDKAHKDACYSLAADFQARFKEKHGDLTCPVLLGLDIRDPAQLAAVREQNLFQSRCTPFVLDAVKITAVLLGIEVGER